MIDRLQNYYDIAIRSNKGNLTKMKQDILASVFHCASSESNLWHDYCEKGPQSWCSYQRDKVNGTKTYLPGVGLPRAIIEDIKPIYKDLSNDKLLNGCLDGITQNQNECFNGYVWNRLPKTKYVGFENFKFGLYDAVAIFNMGRQATLSIIEKMSISPGKYTIEGCSKMNEMRLYNAQYKNKDVSKKTRKVIRGRKKSKTDSIIEKEGKTYEAGGF